MRCMSRIESLLAAFVLQQSTDEIAVEPFRRENYYCPSFSFDQWADYIPVLTVDIHLNALIESAFCFMRLLHEIDGTKTLSQIFDRIKHDPAFLLANFHAIFDYLL